MQVSVIIPTFNEAQRIEGLVRFFLQKAGEGLLEILVVDAAASTDNTVELISGYPKVKVIRSTATCRARQLNEGAEQAGGRFFYFVHADVLPPNNCLEELSAALSHELDFGFFGYRFDSDRWLLKVNAYFTRFENIFTGGGDQTFFIKRSVFEAIGGFDNDLPIMEDFDLFWRLRKAGFNYAILPGAVLVSARKYERNSYLKVNAVNLYTLWMFKMGHCPYRLKGFYSRTLKN